MTTPELADYIAIAQQGRMTPVYRVALADWETPVSAFYKVAAQESYAFLLESVTGGEQIARYSYIGFAPTLILRTKGRTARVWERSTGWRSVEIPPPQTPLDIARALLRRYPYQASPHLPRFTGGLVGYLSYDLVRFFERLPSAPHDDLQTDDCCLIAPEVLLIFDHALHTITILTNPEPCADPQMRYHHALARIDATLLRLRTPLPPPPRYTDPQFNLSPQPNITREAFENAVRKTVEYIHAGDCIQVVLSQRFSQPITAPPFYLYRALRTINPSPYMFYLQFDDTSLIGASPEVLATVEDGRAKTRPIAGTRPRGKTAEDDSRLAEELLADPKERAEHIMLVDLGRNDIGRVSIYGTVRTTDLMMIERYSHVMHIVSEVQGQLRPDADAFDVLRACFPAGTVSGAPKVRAMEIIDELEPTQRGPYAGAVGYFSYTNEMDACITIRTILVKDRMAHVQAGAGVVADSVPEREYDECLNKARAALKAIERAHQGLE
ncbi:MAG: anthranilate synthase component I [Fimbriimonadales bacterium]|nr:MAG: anthranilate synthase component I [Fimbriimonadales bacterium]